MQPPPPFPPVAPGQSAEAPASAPTGSTSAPPPLLADEYLPPADARPARTDDEDAYVLRRPPRTESAGWGLLIGAFGIATLLLAIAVGVLFVYRDRLQGPPETEVIAVEVEEGNDASAASTGSDSVATESTGEKFVPKLKPEELDFRREMLAPYLLVARSDGAAGPKSATGILADAAGHVALPMSSVRGAEAVWVSPTVAGREANPDDAERSPGAVAVDREADWLLIAAPPVAGAPVGSLPRAFDKLPDKGDRLIVAGATERGAVQAFECEVRDAPQAESIDDATRRALESRGWNVERFAWRRVGPVAASLRPGAGVFSLDGVWIGLVASRTPDGKELLMATGPELSSMFASIGPPTPGFLRLDAGVEDGVASADPATPAPGDLAASDPATGSSEEIESTETGTGGAALTPDDPTDPSPFPIDDPKEPPTSEEAGWIAAADELGALVSKLEASGLYAETLEEYLDLADVAENLTTSGKRVAAAPESARAAWEAQRDRALELLATSPWGKDFEAAAHNELAGTHVDAVKGLFFYGEVTAAKDEISGSGDTQPILFQAIGRSDRYVVDMTKNSDEFVKGSKWIVVGIADPRMKINLKTSTDDPGTVVPIVEAKYLIGRPDAATAKATATPKAMATTPKAPAGTPESGDGTKPNDAPKEDDASKSDEANAPSDSGMPEDSTDPADDAAAGDSP